MKENIPEKTVEKFHLKYDEYKATAEEPFLLLKNFVLKCSIWEH